jgi:hypothetical protein
MCTCKACLSEEGIRLKRYGELCALGNMFFELAQIIEKDEPDEDFQAKRHQILERMQELNILGF